MLITIIYSNNNNILDKQFDIFEENIMISELFYIISDLINVEFILLLSNDINLISIKHSSITLETFLREICYNLNLNYNIKNNIITIFENTDYWESYKLNYFYEESNKNGGVNILWSEISNYINGFNIQHAIDRNTGIITIFANKETHNIINTYIEKVNQKLATQIMFECMIVEIFTKTGEYIPINKLCNDAYFLKDKHSLLDIFSIILQNIESYAKLHNTKTVIHNTNKLQIIIRHQDTGYIDCNNEKKSLKYVIGTKKDNKKSTDQSFAQEIILKTGYNITVVPLIHDFNKISVKINANLSQNNDHSQLNINNWVNTHNNKISSSLTLNNEETIVIGGCESINKLEIFTKGENFLQKLYFYFFPSKLLELKGQVFVIIKPKIL
jgi:hypothetical protein